MATDKPSPARKALEWFRKLGFESGLRIEASAMNLTYLDSQYRTLRRVLEAAHAVVKADEEGKMDYDTQVAVDALARALRGEEEA